MLVGGAALSNKFTRRKIAPAYGNMVAYAVDAMKGLELANQIIDPERRAELIQRLEEETAEFARSGARSQRRLWRFPLNGRGGCRRWRRSPSLPTTTAMSCVISIWMRCGRTSIRRCSTPAIWDSGAAEQRRCWRRATRRRSN